MVTRYFFDFPDSRVTITGAIRKGPLLAFASATTFSILARESELRFFAVFIRVVFIQ